MSVLNTELQLLSTTDAGSDLHRRIGARIMEIRDKMETGTTDHQYIATVKVMKQYLDKVIQTGRAGSDKAAVWLPLVTNEIAAFDKNATAETKPPPPTQKPGAERVLQKGIGSLTVGTAQLSQQAATMAVEANKHIRSQFTMLPRSDWPVLNDDEFLTILAYEAQGGIPVYGSTGWSKVQLARAQAAAKPSPQKPRTGAAPQNVSHQPTRSSPPQKHPMSIDDKVAALLREAEQTVAREDARQNPTGQDPFEQQLEQMQAEADRNMRTILGD
eukprot:TRINITY_DN8268_c0_g1_i1.p1 TRINITY_DN8268_c0_g1~~TRINITY_DN8268_c0_g1_i1.p1  ORF type:complete len:272 (+),score=58.81 TRINITY_DN8268_c0_g1_i1:163-978(+)